MGHTTRISDYEMDRAWTRGPETEGVDIEADSTKRKSKVVEGEQEDAPKKSTAKTKSK